MRYRAPRLGERRCTARTLAGERCKRWALRMKKEAIGQPQVAGKEEDGAGAGNARQLCWIHAQVGNNGSLSHGYYRRTSYFSERQRAAIARIARQEQPLSAELLLMRLKLRGVFAYLGREDLQPEERVRVTRLLLRGARAVARLLRAQQAMQRGGWTASSADGVNYLLAQVLAAEGEEPIGAKGLTVED